MHRSLRAAARQVGVSGQEILEEASLQDVPLHHVELGLEMKPTRGYPDLDGSRVSNPGQLLIEIEMGGDLGFAEAEHEVEDLGSFGEGDIYSGAD